MLKAASLDDARERAIAHARAGEDRYENVYGQTVRWSFKELVDVREVWDTKTEDLSEIYTRFFRDYDAYVAYLSEYPD